MSHFREHFLSKLTALLTVGLFLNVSFSAFEINLLGLKNDAGLSEIVSLLLSGTCLEEERETADDIPGPSPESNETEMFFCLQLSTDTDRHLILSDLSKSIFDHPLPIGENHEALIPPPEC